MKQLLLTTYFWLMFIIVTIAGLLVLPFLLLYQVIFSRRTVDSAMRWAISIYGWILVKIVPFLAPVAVETRTESLPLPAIYVPNHTSAIDPYLFGLLLRDVCFVTTWAFKIPVYGFFMRLAKYINANEGWETVCQKGTELLQAGSSLIIWPEGHRSRDGRLGRFKNGAFTLAVKSGYPLVPVCIMGAGRFMPPGRSMFSPSRVKIILLDPIYPNIQNDPHQEIITLRNKVQQVIEKTLREETNSEINMFNHRSNRMRKGLVRGEKC